MGLKSREGTGTSHPTMEKVPTPPYSEGEGNSVPATRARLDPRDLSEEGRGLTFTTRQTSICEGRQVPFISVSHAVPRPKQPTAWGETVMVLQLAAAISYGAVRTPDGGARTATVRRGRAENGEARVVFHTILV